MSAKGKTITVRLGGGRVEQARYDPREVDLETEVVTLRDGSRLTNAKSEAIVAQVRAARKRRQGRPSLSGKASKGVHSPRLTIALTPAIMRDLKREARERKVNVSQVARERLSLRG